MDFSSPERALQSLERRRPALDEALVKAGNALLATPDSSQAYLSHVDTLLHAETDRWEGLAVGILLATNLLVHHSSNNASTNSGNGDAPVEENADGVVAKGKVYIDGPRVPAASNPQEEASILSKLNFTEDQLATVASWLYECALKHLEHNEPRVRTFLAQAVGAHATWSVQHAESQTKTSQQRLQLYKRLLESIQQHIETGREIRQDGSQSKSSTGALDDTTGWRALETNWQCLACWIASLGASYFDLEELDLEPILQQLQYSCNDHLNRHVRAAGIAVLEQMVLAASSSPNHSTLLIEPSSSLRKTIVAVLKQGLADNWSQVRMAASVLNRVLWLALIDTLRVDEANLKLLYPVLLPRMCLNRFYLAQGVKLYSHQTWKLVFQESGVNTVAQTTAPIVRYYVQMCDADNHVVREAACQAVAELAVKLGMSDNESHRAALQPHVTILLQALLMCFHDESWPVRDEACLACGTFCRAYPEECQPELSTLWTRWTEQLTDPIWSVRADAAVALAEACQAYGDDFLKRLLTLIDQLLPSAKNQPQMTREEWKALQNNTEAHENNQLYSCGSLAPKLKKKAGAGRIGCSNCEVNREKQPWEETDGCLYLIRELIETCSQEDSKLPSLQDDLVLPLLTQVADTCRVSHFPQADDLKATLWRQLPAICHALGKVRTKRLYLELFLDLMMSNIESSTASAISKHAAESCAYELGKLVGPSIFIGRIQDDRQQQMVEDVFRQRKFEEQRAQPQQFQTQFSPFEPPGLLDNIDAVAPSISMHPGLPVGVSVGGGAPVPQSRGHPGVDDSFAM